jgi:Peptidase_C39 like family
MKSYFRCFGGRVSCIGLLLVISFSNALAQESTTISSTPQGRTLIRPAHIAAPAATAPSGQATIVSNQFLGFFRFPAELKGEATVPMTEKKAYYRDFFEGGDTFTSGAQDGDTIGAQVFDPNGALLATFFPFTFHKSFTFNGQPAQDCWSGVGGTICNAADIEVLWFISLQCAAKGNYKMSFLYNNAVFFSDSFTLLPQVEASRVPGDNANPVLIDQSTTDTIDYNQLDYEDQMGNFCRTLDANGKVIKHSTHVCHDPLLANEQIATIHQLGCAMTDTAMLLGYHGAFTAPDTLNDWLSVAPDPKHPERLRGYDTGGGINWPAVGDYAATRGIQMAFSWKSSTLPLAQQVCSAGPSIIHTKNDNHWVTTIGQPFDQSTWLLHDPAGGVSRNLSSTNPPYNNKFTGTRSYVGETLSFTTNYGMFIRLHSPAELLLTNPAGQRTGLDPITNTVFKEDPNTSYDDISIGDDEDETQPGIEEKEMMVGVPPSGDYTLQVTGTDTGTYVLEFLGRDTTGASLQTVFPPLPTAPGVVHTFTIHMNLATGTPPAFAGAFDGGGQRPRDVNKFLTYSSPVASQTTASAGSTSFPLIIFYDPAVLPASFAATANGTVVTNLFNPQPGTFEIVNVPVTSGRNVIELSIDGALPTRTARDTDRLVIQVP